MEQSAHAETRQKAPAPVFLAMTIVLFFLSLSAADSIGLVPNYIDGTAPESLSSDADASNSIALSNLPELGTADQAAAATSSAVYALPSRLLIPAIGLDLSIQNPGTRDIQTLDDLLQKGPARYVDSAKLGEAGTMIIFAHSSHLPIVHNPMFKAFNRIPELKAGDMITIEGGGKQYLYAVASVTKADASDTKIDTAPSLGTRLVLVTCDTLTGKSARFVLDASFIGAYDL